MNAEVTYVAASGRQLRFSNPAGQYPVNPYQSLVLAAGCEMVAAAVALRQQKPLPALSAWEPCCGGGPVAIALKDLGLGFVQATDINGPALETCAYNALTNGLELDRMCVADCLSDGSDRTFDIIGFNPPCGVDAVVDEGQTTRLLRAVDGGADGMDFTLRILKDAASRLTANGSLVMIAVSTGNVDRLISALDADFDGRWRVLPAMPVAAPWSRAEDQKAVSMERAAKGYDPLVWTRPDGWVWRLSWVIEISMATHFPRAQRSYGGFPLDPFGYPIDHDPDLQALVEHILRGRPGRRRSK